MNQKSGFVLFTALVISLGLAAIQCDEGHYGASGVACAIAALIFAVITFEGENVI